MYAYIAGPLYNDGERWFDELIEHCACENMLSTYLPHRDLGILSCPEDSAYIFTGDLEHLQKADVVIANLNGMTTDAGTAWEIGYAYARGKHIIGVYTDERMHVKNSEINLMIANSLHILVKSLQELDKYLQKYVSLNGSG